MSKFFFCLPESRTRFPKTATNYNIDAPLPEVQRGAQSGDESSGFYLNFLTNAAFVQRQRAEDKPLHSTFL